MQRVCSRRAGNYVYLVCRFGLYWCGGCVFCPVGEVRVGVLVVGSIPNRVGTRHVACGVRRVKLTVTLGGGNRRYSIVDVSSGGRFSGGRIYVSGRAVAVCDIGTVITLGGK